MYARVGVNQANTKTIDPDTTTNLQLIRSSEKANATGRKRKPTTTNKTEMLKLKHMKTAHTWAPVVRGRGVVHRGPTGDTIATIH